VRSRSVLTTDAKRGQPRAIDCSQSLHLLGRSFQLRHLERQASELLEGLDAAICATELVAPVRAKSPYQLSRSQSRTPRGREAVWEQAIWREWHVAPQRATDFIPGVCRAIVAYQVMLRDTNLDTGWGEIDLLGVASDGLPVVIELKADSSTEPPLRGIVEGIAYAIAVRRAWSQGFARQWTDSVSTPTEPLSLPDSFLSRAVFAAPGAYWDRVLGRKGPKWRVSAAAWARILDLTAAFAARNLFVTLARLEASDDRAPSGITVEVVSKAEILETGR
jgi:hypothetical protein